MRGPAVKRAGDLISFSVFWRRVGRVAEGEDDLRVLHAVTGYDMGGLVLATDDESVTEMRILTFKQFLPHVNFSYSKLISYASLSANCYPILLGEERGKLLFRILRQIV